MSKETSMPGPILPRPWGSLSDEAKGRIHAAVNEIAHELYGTPLSILDPDGHPPTVRRDYHLGRVAATDLIRTWLEHEGQEAAYMAGHIDDAPANYSDLASATGITREGARKRFPGAVKDPRPGRPKKQTTVVLHGGHPQWDGVELEFDWDSVYDCDLDHVGGYLLIPDGSFPDHLEPGVDWRAHYAPETEDTRMVWVFQGWVPS